MNIAENYQIVSGEIYGRVLLSCSGSVARGRFVGGVSQYILFVGVSGCVRLLHGMNSRLYSCDMSHALSMQVSLISTTMTAERKHNEKYWVAATGSRRRESALQCTMIRPIPMTW